jgi:hypothetical protein
MMMMKQDEEGTTGVGNGKFTKHFCRLKGSNNLPDLAVKG